jgi:hypothetical protein
MRKLAAVYWVLGMSLRSVGIALALRGCKLQPYVGVAGSARAGWLAGAAAPVASGACAGSGWAYPLLKGKKRPVLIAVDLGDGRPVAIDRWMKPARSRGASWSPDSNGWGSA